MSLDTVRDGDWESRGTESVFPVDDNAPGTNLNNIRWEMVTPLSAGRLADRALVAGHEGHDGSPLWVIKALQGRELVVGKFIPKYKQAFVPFDGKEVAVQNIEVLLAAPAHVRWVTASNGTVPANAVPGGRSASGEVLYVGRAAHKNSLTPGKVHPSHGCIYISFGGMEHAIRNYEVLCTV